MLLTRIKTLLSQGLGGRWIPIFNNGCDQIKGDYDATEYRSNCPNGFGSDDYNEDCLFLNILVPDSLQIYSLEKRPVMIWLHGGGFMFGSGPGNEIPEYQV